MEVYKYTEGQQNHLGRSPLPLMVRWKSPRGAMDVIRPDATAERVSVVSPASIRTHRLPFPGLIHRGVQRTPAPQVFRPGLKSAGAPGIAAVIPFL
jgi:hypothetical protein